MLEQLLWRRPPLGWHTNYSTGVRCADLLLYTLKDVLIKDSFVEAEEEKNIYIIFDSLGWPQVEAALTPLLIGSQVPSFNLTRGGREGFEQLSCQKQTAGASNKSPRRWNAPLFSRRNPRTHCCPSPSGTGPETGLPALWSAVGRRLGGWVWVWGGDSQADGTAAAATAVERENKELCWQREVWQGGREERREVTEGDGRDEWRRQSSRASQTQPSKLAPITPLSVKKNEVSGCIFGSADSALTSDTKRYILRRCCLLLFSGHHLNHVRASTPHTPKNARNATENYLWVDVSGKLYRFFLLNARCKYCWSPEMYLTEAPGQ